MMGIKERNFQPLSDDLSLEVLVQKDNLYRRNNKTTMSTAASQAATKRSNRGKPIDPKTTRAMTHNCA
jgi:hypothetical protein